MSGSARRMINLGCGRRIHPAWVVPGGVSAPLAAQKRDQILALLPDAAAALDRTVDRFRRAFQSFPEEMSSFANFPSLFLGLTDEEAAAVVSYRERHGDFHAWGDLLIIYGVDGKKIAAAKDKISF